MKRDRPEFEKIPQVPADYVVGAAVASKKWWWLPIVFVGGDVFLSTVNSLAWFGFLAALGWLAMASLEFVPTPGIGFSVGVAGSLAAFATSIWIVRSLLWGSSWSTFAKTVKREPITPFEDAAEYITDGMIGRLFVGGFRIIGTLGFVTSMLSGWIWYRTLEPSTVEEKIWFSAGIGAMLMVGSLVGLVIGLAGSQVPVVRFYTREGWGRSSVKAFIHTIKHTELIYRVFLAALLIIFPALILMYFAAFLQSVAIEIPQLFGLSTTVRSFGNLMLTASFAASAFYFQAASFWVLAICSDDVEATPCRKPSSSNTAVKPDDTHSGIEDVMPENFDYIFPTRDLFELYSPDPDSTSEE